VESRKYLLKQRLMGPTVYNNAVAFLRIRGPDLPDLHPLDDTRLHPDVYIKNTWAKKIAIDALEKEDDNRDDHHHHLLEVMRNSKRQVELLYNQTKDEWESEYGNTFQVNIWDPRRNVPDDRWQDKVEELDLEAFAERIEENGMGKWLTQFLMIKWEFRLPFQDPRKPMEPLTGDKLFRLITGESDTTLRPGYEVTGKVTKNGDFGSRLKLEGDIDGFIPLRNLADEHVQTPEDIVSAGQVITATITEVKKDHICIDLSLKMEDFRRHPSSWERPKTLPPLDQYFDKSAAKSIEMEKNAEREVHLAKLERTMNNARNNGDGNHEPEESRKGKVSRRACVHPAFRNLRQGGGCVGGGGVDSAE